MNLMELEHFQNLVFASSLQLSVTKHAPDIQLKVSDLSVRPLWSNLGLKHLLVAVGYHQIGSILNFNRTPDNK